MAAKMLKNCKKPKKKVIFLGKREKKERGNTNSLYTLGTGTFLFEVPSPLNDNILRILSR
jgi:hypothetical protein